MRRRISEGVVFFNISSEIPDDKVQIHEIIRQHKKQVKKIFTSEIRDEILADNIYLLFETSLVMSRIYRSNELIIKSKIIIEGLLKKLIFFSPHQYQSHFSFYLYCISIGKKLLSIDKL